MFLDSNHVLKVYLKPSRKNQEFLFLPLSSVPVLLKIRFLKHLFFSAVDKGVLGMLGVLGVLGTPELGDS